MVLLAPDPVTQSRVQRALGEHGILVAAASTPADVERLIELDQPAAVLVDTRQATHKAFALSYATRNPPLVALVDPHDGDAVRQLLAAGVLDVVPHPLAEALLMHRLRAALEAGRMASSNPPRAKRPSSLLVGRSPEMVDVARRIEVIAKSDMGAAIFGETGTGKELAARTIHKQSRRGSKPLVVANCTALPEALFENELFGHERGAFTGADSRRDGLLAEAEGGTLLLDEIGDIALGAQAKLLRLMQFHEYKRIGGTKTLKADVRILTSTHRDLAAMVAQRQFRQDLFYRLNVLDLKLPPLRDRLDDLPLLVDHFVSSYNEQEGARCAGFDAEAIRALQRHDWPGNVRELEGVVYRSLVIAGHEERLGPDDLDLVEVASTDGEAETVPRVGLDLTRPFAEVKASLVEGFERRYLEALLERNQGNLSRAAREARHERKSLWRLMSKYGIDPKAFRSSQTGSK